MKLFTLSPLTQKRLERFRRSRVAFWSLILLSVIYLLSLGAELICNDKPLLMRFNGEWLFPFLSERPPQAILEATGEMVYVNYRRFVESETFTQNPDNFVLFAPVPYGPDETIETADMENAKVVTITLTPSQPVGRFNLIAAPAQDASGVVRNDYRIVRQDNCAQFFPTGVTSGDLRDGAYGLSDLVTITDDLRANLDARLRGEDLGEATFTVSPANDTLPWKTLMLTLAPVCNPLPADDPVPGAYRPPVSLRVTLRHGLDVLGTQSYVVTRTVKEDGKPGDILLPDVGDARLAAGLKKWGGMAFYDTIDAGDQTDDRLRAADGIPVIGDKLTTDSAYGPAGTPIHTVEARWLTDKGVAIANGIDITLGTLAQDCDLGAQGAEAVRVQSGWEIGENQLAEPALILDGHLVQDCPVAPFGTPVHQVDGAWQTDLGKPIGNAILLSGGKLRNDYVDESTGTSVIGGTTLRHLAVDTFLTETGKRVKGSILRLGTESAWMDAAGTAIPDGILHLSGTTWANERGEPLTADTLTLTQGKWQSETAAGEIFPIEGKTLRLVKAGNWVTEDGHIVPGDKPAIFFEGRLVRNHPTYGTIGTQVRFEDTHWETDKGQRISIRSVGDLTSMDNQVFSASPTAPVYRVTSSNNIRFPFHPTGAHICGLDGSGRDVFARIVYATRIAMSFGLLLAFSATLLGMIIGSLQGYFGGKVDIVVQRFTEIWAALPFLYIMVLVGSIFGQSFWLLLLVYGLFCWLGLSYYMRAEFFRLRDRPFVAAARCQGLGNARIIFRHILPNALTPIITLFPFLLVGAISALVSLDFLGFGLPPLTPSWGELLSQAQRYREAWWLILFPSVAIFMVMFLTVMVGEGVRNAFDPKPFSKLQ